MKWPATKVACLIAWPSAVIEVALGPFYAALGTIIVATWVLVWLRRL
jgi:hypothetical protein